MSEAVNVQGSTNYKKYSMYKDDKTTHSRTQHGPSDMTVLPKTQGQARSPLAAAPRDERVAVSGLSPEESTSGGVAHLRECPAYCECELYREVALEGEEDGLVSVVSSAVAAAPVKAFAVAALAFVFAA